MDLEEFESSQLWVVSYKEEVPRGGLQGYRAFVRACSNAEAKDVFFLKIESQEPDAKIKMVRVSRVQQDLFKKRRRKLSLLEWEAFRKLSYPNTLNFLFKIESQYIAQPQSELSAKKKSEALRGNKNGFGGRRGKNSWSYLNLKGKTLPSELRPYYRYRGRWVKISKEEREAERDEFISFFIKANGNRSEMARIMGRSRNYVNKYIKLFPETNWDALIEN
jgi:hypothetical protein